MDKPEKPRIPINTRIIGKPEGIYLLYLEDYVHTFIKKMIFEKKESKDEFTGEPVQEAKISLYGERFEENGQSIMVVSGAADCEKNNTDESNIAQKYFPGSSFLGYANVSLNRDNGIRFEISINSTRVILDDFYIYYDQNEEMQNYLIEWNNLVRENNIQSSGVRTNTDNAVHLGRIAQAYNKEEARVSFIWGVMNVMCMGFVICVMVYGIISINNYSKMKSMQESIDYCMTLVSENIKKNDEISAVMNRIDNYTNISTENKTNNEDSAAKEEMPEEANTALTQTKDFQDNAAADNTSALENPDLDTFNSESYTPETQPAISQNDTLQPPSTPTTAVPQYYVVQPGDTLRGISFKVYGDYRHVDEICAQNGINDPNNILYGQKLLLP